MDNQTHSTWNIDGRTGEAVPVPEPEEKQALVAKIEAAREAMKGLKKLWSTGMFALRFDGYRGPFRATTYVGPRHRGDGFDQVRLDAAIAKRNRRRERNLRLQDQGGFR